MRRASAPSEDREGAAAPVCLAQRVSSPPVAARISATLAREIDARLLDVSSSTIPAGAPLDKESSRYGPS
jgi:hypothetical protein